MPILVLLRHGKSTYNLEKRFAGRLDIPLAEEGRQEAKEAARLLIGYRFDKAYTSSLQRAIHTLDIILSELNHPPIPIIKTPKLNERHQGILEGMSMEHADMKYGKEQAHIWERGYGSGPPGGETSKDLEARALSVLHQEIIPDLDQGKNVLVVSHSNPIRFMVKDIEKMDTESCKGLHIGNSVPLIYERNGGKFSKRQLI
ncbi:MAG: 2,3-bisphosphoglycerate-dependent phosphoglycerate mutase [Candidatus Aenigmarchaeota archaeon]|nr:2,3-bisphosphoglycerate-dependent phosphoglycerate mutase [Candidatus Aenigmarchaeota archaeon]